jgi:hypothetical protein
VFFKGSRYAGVGTGVVAGEDGRLRRYKKTRFIRQPRPGRLHPVSQQDRLDLIAHAHLHDAERFWRVCDLNFALWPDDLLAVPGRTIAIPTGEE